ncbi:MAG: hypothetical protein ABI824_03085 [Acidobacteriota bacterium]
MTRVCVLALCIAWTLEAQPKAPDTQRDSLRIRAFASLPDPRETSTNNVTSTAQYEAGSRATTGITIEVTTLGGQPVDGAMVTLQMPSGGPSGVFRNNSKTEVLTTGPDGKIEAWGMLWNATPGTASIRVTAAKGPDHGTATASVLLTTPPPRTTTRNSSGDAHGHKKLWLAIAAVAGSSIAVAGVARNKGTPSTTAPAANTTISISTPTIVITKPSARQ